MNRVDINDRSHNCRRRFNAVDRNTPLPTPLPCFSLRRIPYLTDDEPAEHGSDVNPAAGESCARAGVSVTGCPPSRVGGKNEQRT